MYKKYFHGLNAPSQSGDGSFRLNFFSAYNQSAGKFCIAACRLRCFERGSRQCSQQRGRRSRHSGVTQSQKTENGPKCVPIFTKHDADSATLISCRGGDTGSIRKLSPMAQHSSITAKASSPCGVEHLQLARPSCSV